MEPTDRLATLGDMIYRLRNTAEELSIYGESTAAQGMFAAILPQDQTLFLYLAMLEGSDDSQFVANYLARSVDKSLIGIDALYRTLTDEDKHLVESLSKPITSDARRVRNALGRACEAIGNLPYEEAYWIVIPVESSADSQWLPIRQDGMYAYVRWPFMVAEDPRSDASAEASRLTLLAPSARWVLNVHNHPHMAGYETCDADYISEPSDGDYIAVAHWKALVPQLALQLRFFVIHEKTVVEYGLRERRTHRWSVA